MMIVAAVLIILGLLLWLAVVLDDTHTCTYCGMPMDEDDNDYCDICHRCL